MQNDLIECNYGSLVSRARRDDNNSLYQTDYKQQPKLLPPLPYIYDRQCKFISFTVCLYIYRLDSNTILQNNFSRL